MSKDQEIEIVSADVTGMFGRVKGRLMRLCRGTVELIAHFMGLGDDKPTAKGKVTQVSQHLTVNSPGVKFDYLLGDKQPLKDAINAITMNDLSFMDADAKAALSDNL